MNYPEQLMVLNPLISQYEKRYIIGTGFESVRLFKELCSRRIYIHGFIMENKAGILFFHKKVFSIKDLVPDSSVILLTLNHEEQTYDYPVCSNIFVFNEKIYNKKLVIYGAGYVGKMTFLALQDKGIDILGFIDSDKNKIGAEVCGKKIYEPQFLDTLQEGIAVIEAGKGVREIDILVQTINKRLERFVIQDWSFFSDTIWIDQRENITLNLSCILSLQEFCENSKVDELILYGNDIALAKKYAELYECLDFCAVSFMTSQKENVSEKVSLIEEILYKDKFLILLYEEDEIFFLDKLQELGVERQCVHVNYPCSPNFYNRNSILDINLGYTYEMNSEYPGVYIYGKNLKEDYKIVVLGGSTTDSMLDNKNRSWVEIMFNEYCPEGITIFNGAISGYSSDQELTKLIRDMMRLLPNMVIIYDGFNDIFWEGESKFGYLESLVQFASKYIKCFDKHVGNNKICKGIKKHDNIAEEWLENIQYMYSIAKSRNAVFYSFVQPMLCTKMKLDKHSDSLMEMLNHIYAQTTINSARMFREKAKEIVKAYPYITDLSYIFDDEDVYMDMCHVYEYGNEIIARHIWNAIVKDVI